MNQRPTAAIVIATYNRPEFVRTCLEHIGRQTVVPQRVIVVDASPDMRTRAIVERFDGVEYRRNEKGRGSTATSRAIGLEGIREEVVAFIDDDAFAEPHWLEELTRPYSDPEVAAVGGRALNDQPGEQTAGVGEIGLLLPDGRLTGWFAADPGRLVDVDHMLGANMSLRVQAVRALGGIRDFYPGTCLREETDIALRMRKAGMRIVYAPAAVVRHVAGDYAKGRRFDARYGYFGARNHVVLLATALGWGDPHLRRYLRTVAGKTARELRGGVRAMVSRDGLRPRLQGLLGGVRRAAIEVIGTFAGIGAAVRASIRLARGENGVR